MAQLVPQLTNLATPETTGHAAFPTWAIIDEFWLTDKQLCKKEIFAGTTASLLLLAPSNAGDGSGGLDCTICWVGDSLCVRADIGCDASDAAFLSTTTDHTPKNDAERARLELEWKVRAELEADHDIDCDDIDVNDAKPPKFGAKERKDH